MTQEAQELKACPCCNRKASLERRRGMQTATSGKWYRERVYCRNKKCGLTTATFNRPDQAIAAWNARTPDSVNAELVEAARDVLGVAGLWEILDGGKNIDLDASDSVKALRNALNKLEASK